MLRLLPPGRRVAQHSRLALGHRRDRLKPDRRAARALEEAHTVAEEHRCDVHEDLVQEPGFEALSRDVGTEHAHVEAAGRRAGNRYSLLNGGVEEPAGYALNDGGLVRWVVA